MSGEPKPSDADGHAPRFVPIVPGHASGHYRLVVDERLCVGPGQRPFLFGGVGLGAAISALETTIGRPLRWIAAQYLSHAAPGETVDLRVASLSGGRRVTQASVAASVGGRTILTASAALGSGEPGFEGCWVEPPVAPAPETLPRTLHWRGRRGVHAAIDVRVVRGRYGAGGIGLAEPDGRLVLWARPLNAPIDLPFLAVLADFVPAGIGNALGLDAGGTSLDNSLRVLDPRPTEWVLVDIAINAVADGVVHGSVRLFAHDGILMAIGSQTLMLRLHGTPPTDPHDGAFA